ncbi:MAG: sulfotransferase [Candidatus Sulfotelmatobacter sp.]
MADKKTMKTVLEPASGPLFIASMWRGGSSLLYALLNKHPQVALMFEADLLLLRPVFLKPSEICDWSQRWELWNQTFSRHGLDPAEFTGINPEFRHVFETVHKEYALRKNAAIWGDKSPNYHDQLLRIAKDFPSARFIIVWRDPLQTIGATLRAAATGSRFFRKRRMPWRSLFGYRAFKWQCGQIISAGAAVHQLHYEDLVDDTAVVMQRVCAFLDIPYDSSLCTLENADRSAVYAGRHHNLLRENAIVAVPRPDVIEPSLRRMVMRYVTSWSEIDCSNRNPSHHAVPSLTQLQLDRIRYRLFRALDVLIRLGFCFLPVPLLRLYRKTKAGTQQVSTAANSLKFLPQTDIES